MTAGPLADFDTLVTALRERKREAEADELHELLHAIAWTSSSEMLGELGLKLRGIAKGTPEPDRQLRELVERCRGVVRGVWPEM